MTSYLFEPVRLYKPTDEEMRIFGTVGTLSQWRHRRYGPDFIRWGRTVYYKGSALNDWIERHTNTAANPIQRK